tara:strand:- start:2833 stop:3306 length:474 start_codon:yes stop_codon:yes gene_type:complete
MKIVLVCLGATNNHYLQEGIANYIKRLKHYINFEMKEIVVSKNKKTSNKNMIMNIESDLILSYLLQNDYVILLDENGKGYDSKSFAKKIENFLLHAQKRLVFVIGGAFGFNNKLRSRANEMLSLSNMTFSHQMIRLFFLEQIYRGFTIINNHPYHNE